MALLTGLGAILGLGPVQGLLGVKWPSATVGLCSIGATVIAMVIGSLAFPDRKDHHPFIETETGRTA